jgi:hypothetical protein
MTTSCRLRDDERHLLLQEDAEPATRHRPSTQTRAASAKSLTLRMGKNPHAVALGRRGGKKGGPKGGKARMAGLTDAQRRELARKAAQARWKKAKKKP